MTPLEQKITPIAVSYGDGDGPEIMEHILSILQQADARISVNSIDIGANFYKREHYSGIPDSAWQTMTHHPVIFMAPSAKPESDEYHDLLETLCRCLELHTVAAPLSHKTNGHFLIGRNEAAFQRLSGYRLQHQTLEELRLFTEKQTRNLIHHAGSVCHLTQTPQLHSITYSNSSLSAHRLKELAQETLAEHTYCNYQEFTGTLAQFLKRDSDDASVIISQENGLLNTLSLIHNIERRGIGFLGEHFLLFTGANTIATFEGQLHAAILMLVFLNQTDIASRLHHVWMEVLNENPDIISAPHDAYASAIMQQLEKLKDSEIDTSYRPLAQLQSRTKSSQTIPSQTSQKLIGVEMTLATPEQYTNAKELADKIEPLCTERPLQLQRISTRGFPVWPKAEPYYFEEGDYLTLRFLSNQTPKSTSAKDIIALLTMLEEAHIRVTAMRHLYLYDEHIGFSV